MSRERHRSVVDLTDVSRRAWAFVGAGIALIALGVYASIGFDHERIATWANFPWLTLFTSLLSVLLLLVAANLGSGHIPKDESSAPLARRVLVSFAWMAVAATMPISLAISCHRSIGDATQFALGGLMVAQMLGTLPQYECSLRT